MTYSHLFKPPYKAVAPDILQGRAERAGKLRTPRGPGGGAPSGEAANNGGSGRSDAAGAAAGAAGNNSSGNMSCDDCAAGTAAAAQQQTSGSGGCNNTEARAPVATAAAGKPDKPERRSDTPNGGAAGSNDSQDSLIKNGVGFGDDSDKAEGYGSNPTGVATALMMVQHAPPSCPVLVQQSVAELCRTKLSTTCKPRLLTLVTLHVDFRRQRLQRRPGRQQRQWQWFI